MGEESPPPGDSTRLHGELRTTQVLPFVCTAGTPDDLGLCHRGFDAQMDGRPGVSGCEAEERRARWNGSRNHVLVRLAVRRVWG